MSWFYDKAAATPTGPRPKCYGSMTNRAKAAQGGVSRELKIYRNRQLSNWHNQEIFRLAVSEHCSSRSCSSRSLRLPLFLYVPRHRAKPPKLPDAPKAEFANFGCATGHPCAPLHTEPQNCCRETDSAAHSHITQRLRAPWLLP